MTVSEDVFEPVPIKVSLEKKNLESEEEDTIRKCWEKALAASLVPPRQFKYEANFLCLLQSVLERDSHLLNSEERTFLSKPIRSFQRLIELIPTQFLAIEFTSLLLSVNSEALVALWRRLLFND